MAEHPANDFTDYPHSTLFRKFRKTFNQIPQALLVDTGLVCFLLGIESTQELEKSPFLGNIFESFVASEIIKNQVGRSRPQELYFFRDEQGLEVDFLTPLKGKKLALIEVKSTGTLNPSFIQPMKRLSEAIESRKEKPKEVKQYLVYRPIERREQESPFFSSTTKALTYTNLLAEINND